MNKTCLHITQNAHLPPSPPFNSTDTLTHGIGSLSLHTPTTWRGRPVKRYLCTGLTTWFHLEGVVWNRSSVQANAVIQGIFHLKEKIQPHCWKRNIERRHSRPCGLGYTTGGQQTQPAEGDLILPISEVGGQPWDGELRGSSKGCICKGNRGGGEKEQDVGKKEKKGSLSGPRRKNGLGPDGFDPLTALGFKPCLSTMKQF